jgi:Bacterial Ig-like domain (group 1)
MAADRNARNGRFTMQARFGLPLALAALILLSAVGPATASATSVEFSRGSYVAPLGQAFPDPISVTVKDGLGDPAPGVEVAFSVTPDSTGATATISAPTATTDGNGVAQITGTAGTQAGFPTVHATADGASATAQLVNRPPGYRPGEKLASIMAQNQDGVTEDVRSGLDGKTFLLVDVCAGWCDPCKAFAENAEQAIIDLAILHGVKLKLVTLLQQGADHEPSEQADAQQWKSDQGLTGSVLHAGGSADSALYRGAGFFLADNDPFASNAFPTHLLVDPKGTILDRQVGVDSAQQTVDRVLSFIPTKTVNPPKVTPVGQVDVQLPNGETRSEVFNAFGSQNGIGLFGNDVGGIAEREWSYTTPGLFPPPLPASGTLTLSLTRFKTEARQPLKSSTVSVTAGMRIGSPIPPGNPGFAAVQAETTLPAAQDKKTGKVTVATRLETLRAAMEAKLEAGQYAVTAGNLPSPPTQQQIDDLVASMFGVAVTAQYTIIK